MRCDKHGEQPEHHITPLDVMCQACHEEQVKEFFQKHPEKVAVLRDRVQHFLDIYGMRPAVSMGCKVADLVCRDCQDLPKEPWPVLEQAVSGFKSGEMAVVYGRPRFWPSALYALWLAETLRARKPVGIVDAMYSGSRPKTALAGAMAEHVKDMLGTKEAGPVRVDEYTNIDRAQIQALQEHLDKTPSYRQEQGRLHRGKA